MLDEADVVVEEHVDKDEADRSDERDAGRVRPAEKDARNQNSHEPQQEHVEGHDAHTPLHLHAKKDANGHPQDEQVGEDVEAALPEVKNGLVKAGTAGNAVVPEVGDRTALKDGTELDGHHQSQVEAVESADGAADALLLTA